MVDLFDDDPSFPLVQLNKIIDFVIEQKDNPNHNEMGWRIYNKFK